MRKLNPLDFRLATRQTSRDVNRQIALNLIREHQPLSRADLARHMGVRRSVITTLVNELVASDVLDEAPVETVRRGRPPTLLSIRTADRLALAIDIRYSQTTLLLADFDGHAIESTAFDTIVSPDRLVGKITVAARALLSSGKRRSRCEGIGLIVPGMVDEASGRVLNAPQLGWRDVDIAVPLSRALRLPVRIENAPVACASAKMWLGRGTGASTHDFAYVIVSDGIGVGLVADGRVLRGATSTAGEFGHLPLSMSGPRCLCGREGCWEAYTSNLATVARFEGKSIGHEPGKPRRRGSSAAAVQSIVALARDGDVRATRALEETGRFLGLGLSNIITAVNPARIIVGGEITAAWDLLEDAVRDAVSARTLTAAAAATPIEPDQTTVSPRLLGGAALVAAPRFAMPQVA
jgi:N-acetylglucosamine repressor